MSSAFPGPVNAPDLTFSSESSPRPSVAEWMSVANQHTAALTRGSNVALNAKCPPRHIPVTPILPLQFGSEVKRSIASVASWGHQQRHNVRMNLPRRNQQLLSQPVYVRHLLIRANDIHWPCICFRGPYLKSSRIYAIYQRTLTLCVVWKWFWTFELVKARWTNCDETLRSDLACKALYRPCYLIDLTTLSAADQLRRNGYLNTTMPGHLAPGYPGTTGCMIYMR